MVSLRQVPVQRQKYHGDLKRHRKRIHGVRVQMHRENKHGMAVSEKEADNISKMSAPNKETKISQNKKHRHKEDTSTIQETLFKENSEDTTHRNLLTTRKRNATILSLQNSTYHITNDNTESRLRLKHNLTKTKLTQ